MKLLSWNINSLPPTTSNVVLKYGSWENFFSNLELDVVCLQEAKVPKDKLTKELCCIKGYQSFWACSEGKRGYSGVTTYCSTAWAPIACELDSLADFDPGDGESGPGDDPETNQNESISQALSEEGRFVLTDFGPKAFILVNVYVPNAGDHKTRPRLQVKMRFLRSLLAKCKALVAAKRSIVLVGDFNVASDRRDVDARIGLETVYTQEERGMFDSFLSSHGGPFVDAWRHRHPDEDKGYTQWDEKTSARAFNEGIRIDYVLVTPDLAQRLVTCDIVSTEVLPPKWSDHAGVLVEFNGLNPPHSPRPPCKEWIALKKRFHDSSQKSILSMFARSSGKDDAPITGVQGSEAKKRPGRADPSDSLNTQEKRPRAAK